MNEELIEYLDKKFNKIDTELEGIKTDVVTNKENIEGIKTDVAVNRVNIQEGFAEAKADREELREKIDDTYNAVDGFVKTVDKLDQEFVLMKEEQKRTKEVVREKLGVDLA